MAEFITCGDTRIKISNIKQYGISIDHVEKEIVEKSEAEKNQIIKEYEQKKEEYYRIKNEKKKDPGNVIKGIGGGIGGAIGGGFAGLAGGAGVGGAVGNVPGAAIGAVVGGPVGLITGAIHYGRKAMGIPKKPEKPSENDFMKEKEHTIHYLYITTYQNDNFKFVEGKCGFDIFEKRKELDNLLA